MSDPIDLSGARVLMVAALYYEDVTAHLVEGARAALEAAGVAHDIVETAGAFEIPGVIAQAALAGGAGFEGYVALGCVIRGETSHYDHICAETARALMDLSLQGVPVGYGILTVENIKQARLRADKGEKDKGGEAARAVLSLIAAKGRFQTAKA